LFDLGRFFVPTSVLRSAGRSRGQGWPQATAGGGAQRPWRRRARCDALWVGTWRALWVSMTWSLAWAVCKHAATPHHLVSGRARWPDTL